MTLVHCSNPKRFSSQIIQEKKGKRRLITMNVGNVLAYILQISMKNKFSFDDFCIIYVLFDGEMETLKLYFFDS